MSRLMGLNILKIKSKVEKDLLFLYYFTEIFSKFIFEYNGEYNVV